MKHLLLSRHWPAKSSGVIWAECECVCMCVCVGEVDIGDGSRLEE